MTSSGWTRQRRCEYRQTTVQEPWGATWGQYSFGFYGLFAGWLVFSVLRGARQGMSKGSVEHFMLVSVAFAWLIVRVLFSTWWSPGTPFLFAVMSIPALWLLCLLFLSAPAASRRTLPDSSSLRRRVIAVAVVAAIVWIHNSNR